MKHRKPRRRGTNRNRRFSPVDLDEEFPGPDGSKFDEYEPETGSAPDAPQPNEA